MWGKRILLVEFSAAYPQMKFQKLDIFSNFQDIFFQISPEHEHEFQKNKKIFESLK
jgi:hypothetical protein